VSSLPSRGSDKILYKQEFEYCNAKLRQMVDFICTTKNYGHLDEQGRDYNPGSLATALVLTLCSTCILFKKLPYISIPKSLDRVMESELPGLTPARPVNNYFRLPKIKYFNALTIFLDGRKIHRKNQGSMSSNELQN
jgi:hypothetical protein